MDGPFEREGTSGVTEVEAGRLVGVGTGGQLWDFPESEVVTGGGPGLLPVSARRLPTILQVQRPRVPETQVSHLSTPFPEVSPGKLFGTGPPPETHKCLNG